MSKLLELFADLSSFALINVDRLLMRLMIGSDISSYWLNSVGMQDVYNDPLSLSNLLTTRLAKDVKCIPKS